MRVKSIAERASLAAFGGTTTGISINLVTLMAVSAGNTYDQTGFEVSANGSGVNCCWGGPNVVASVTVTSMSATRIAGTFTATLPKVSGGAPGNLVITNGAFDTKVQ